MERPSRKPLRAGCESSAQHTGGGSIMLERGVDFDESYHRIFERILRSSSKNWRPQNGLRFAMFIESGPDTDSESDFSSLRGLRTDD